MAAPTILGSRAFNSGTYAATLNSTSSPIDFGTGTGRWISVVVLTTNNAVNVDSVAIAGGGTLTADVQIATPLSIAGTGRSFYMQGDGGAAVPSGVATVTATCSSAAGFIQMLVTWGNGASVIGSATHNAQAGGVLTWTVSGTTADDLCVVSGFETAQTVAGGNAWTAPYVTIAGSSGSTLGVHTVPPSSGFVHAVSVNEVGAAGSTVLGLTTTGYQFTPGVGAWAFKVTGTVPTGPTIDAQPTAQTADEGATASFGVTATSSGGTLHYQWNRQAPAGGAFSNVGADATPYTTAALDCATDHGANFYCAVSDDNGTTNTDTVSLTVRSVVTISRPASDVAAGGWTPSTGATCFGVVDETSADSADYMESPALTSTPVWNTTELKYPLSTSDRIVDIELWVPGSTGTLKVRFENDAGTVVGTAADQAVTSTPTIYSLPITLSGPATRISVAVVA